MREWPMGGVSVVVLHDGFSREVAGMSRGGRRKHTADSDEGGGEFKMQNAKWQTH
jgi:hypothetical protein